MGLLCLGTGWIIFSLWNSRTVIFKFFKLLIFKKNKMSPPESQSAQRWLTHGRSFQRNIPLTVFELADLLTECAAPSAEACCRRDAARSLFLSTGAVGRPPSTSFPPERAVPCFHFLSAAARPVPPLRVWLWAGGWAGHQIQRLQKHRSLRSTPKSSAKPLFLMNCRCFARARSTFWDSYWSNYTVFHWQNKLLVAFFFPILRAC